jgi:hypothetical protein
MRLDRNARNENLCDGGEGGEEESEESLLPEPGGPGFKEWTAGVQDREFLSCCSPLALISIPEDVAKRFLANWFAEDVTYVFRK